ncbi:LOW QUALITY PROTEIN: olfactory receptor 13H1 [Rhynchonycteris naso]
MDDATAVFEFLIGISNYYEWRVIFFTLVLIIYFSTLLGSVLIILFHIHSNFHTLMYFFLNNLSLLDLCYGTVSMPQALLHCFSTHSYLSRCLTQMNVSLVFAIVEYFLLALIDYYHLVVISNPLCYSMFINYPVCVLAATLWRASLVLTAMLILTLHLYFCGAHVINHFVCKILYLLKTCSDRSLNDLMILVTCIFTLYITFGFVLLSYVQIATVVLKIHSSQSRLRAFSTCSSHFTVVTIFYGAVNYMYMKHQSKLFLDDKVISVLYGALTPMLNSLIYNLRTKDINEVMRKVTVIR